MIPQKKHPSPWYTAFSLTWLAFMQIYWNKRKRLHKKKVSTPTGLVWYTNMAAVSLFWNINMAAVTSWENALLHTRRVARQHVLLMNLLELSYQGHPTTFFCKICGKEQILPGNLSNLGKASLFPCPLFSLLRSSSARMKIEIAGIY